MNTDKIIQALLKEFKNLEDTDTSGWKQPQSIQEVLTANVASVIALVTQYHDGSWCSQFRCIMVKWGNQMMGENSSESERRVRGVP